MAALVNSCLLLSVASLSLSLSLSLFVSLCLSWSSACVYDVFLFQESAERALGTPGWEEVAQRNGVTVWKKYFPKVMDVTGCARRLGGWGAEKTDVHEKVL